MRDGADRRGDQRGRMIEHACLPRDRFDDMRMTVPMDRGPDRRDRIEDLRSGSVGEHRAVAAHERSRRCIEAAHLRERQPMPRYH